MFESMRIIIIRSLCLLQKGGIPLKFISSVCSMLLCCGVMNATDTIGSNMAGSDSISLEEKFSPGTGRSLSADIDTLSFAHRYIHRLDVEVRPDYIIPSHSFLKGNNETGEKMRTAFSIHAKYAFQFHPDSYVDRIYKNVYQGVGVAYYNFGEQHYLGTPVALFLYQGARLAQFSPVLSLNYEWNFGLSYGWNCYDAQKNPSNAVIGSKLDAYINANLYLKWMLSKKIDFTLGAHFTHFSNGNTKIPNAGLNLTGLKIGLVYNFNRKEEVPFRSTPVPHILDYPAHVSYDFLLFGSWRRTGVYIDDKQIASPDAYTVLGFNFAPMYNFNYKFRAGLSLDGVYDGSANIYVADEIVPLGGDNHDHSYSIQKPAAYRQMALGVSGRAEFVMPYFTVGVGWGRNVIYGGRMLNYSYQIVALKIEMTSNTFLHIGYNVKNFHSPNFLMLGLGIRLHNKRPPLH